jgi:hypothetical protein
MGRGEKRREEKRRDEMRREEKRDEKRREEKRKGLTWMATSYTLGLAILTSALHLRRVLALLSSRCTPLLSLLAPPFHSCRR